VYLLRLSLSLLPSSKQRDRARTSVLANPLRQIQPLEDPEYPPGYTNQLRCGPEFPEKACRPHPALRALRCER
jgi:hypothetical protein